MEFTSMTVEELEARLAQLPDEIEIGRAHV